MAVKNKGLGRDYFSLLEDNFIDSKGKITSLRISSIEPKRDQPRKDFDQESLSALADSIAKYGVLQPILVREIEDQNYQIIAGERRWRASKLAGLVEVPVIVIDSDELKAAEIAIVENVQRKDLNAVEEALAYKALIENFSVTQEAVSASVGKSRSAITNALRLLELPDEVISMLRVEEISAGHARALLSLQNEDDKLTLANRIIEKGMSVRATEEEVKALNIKLNQAKNAEKNDQPEEKVVVDYIKELEGKIMSSLGRKVKITNGNRKKSVELYFEDNDDLEVILNLLGAKDSMSDFN